MEVSQNFLEDYIRTYLTGVIECCSYNLNQLLNTLISLAISRVIIATLSSPTFDLFKLFKLINFPNQISLIIQVNKLSKPTAAQANTRCDCYDVK